MMDLQSETAELSKSEKCELRIEGMTCGSCVEVSVLNIIPTVD